MNLITISFAALLLATPAQQSQSISDSSTYDLDECTVILIEDIELPALESGQLTDILVQPGTQVKKDQILAQMDDSRSRRSLEEAKLRHKLANDQANDGTEEKAAHKRAQLAYAEYKKANKLRRTGSMSDQQAERSKVSAEIANLEYTGAKNARALAATRAAAEMVVVQTSQDSIDRHAIKSKIAGVVYEINRDAGEWVTVGQTVMKIARMDKLRITRLVDGNRFEQWQLDNRRITATLTLASGEKVEFKGEVVYLDTKKRLNNTFMLYADVENRMHPGGTHWLLSPGSVVEMKVHLKESIAQSSQRDITGESRK